jgi:hypothetical protein
MAGYGNKIGSPKGRMPGGTASGISKTPGGRMPGKPGAATPRAMPSNPKPPGAIGNPRTTVPGGPKASMPGTRSVNPAKPPSGSLGSKSRTPGVKVMPGSNGKRLPGKPGALGGGGPATGGGLPPMGGRKPRGL